MTCPMNILYQEYIKFFLNLLAPEVFISCLFIPLRPLVKVWGEGGFGGVRQLQPQSRFYEELFHKTNKK